MIEVLFLIMFTFQIAFGAYFYLLNPKELGYKLNAAVIFLSSWLIFVEYYIYKCETAEAFIFNNHAHTILIALIGILETFCIWLFSRPFRDHPKEKEYTRIFFAGLFISFFVVIFPAVSTDQVIIVLNEKVGGKWGYYVRFDTLAGKAFIGWYMAMILVVNSMLFLGYKRSTNIKIKQWNFRLFFVFLIVTLAMFSFFVLLPSTGSPARYEIGLFYCIIVFFLANIFSYYKLFDVTPKTALDNILDSVSNLILLTDHNLQLKYSNKLASEALGIKSNFSNGLNILDILGKAGTVETPELLHKVGELGIGKRTEFSFTTKKEDRPKYYFFVVTKLIKNQDLHAGYTFVGTDITSLIEKEMELKEYNEQLEKTNLELERFAYVASHDLKTPLRNVTSFISLLRRELKGHENKNVQDYVEFVQTNAKTMYTLIEEILEYSKLKTMEAAVAPTDMNAVLQSVEKNLFFYKETKNAVIKYHDLPTILVNQNQMLRLFQNMVENGLKYNKSNTPLVHITFYQKNEDLIFKVEDNGIGIAPAYHEQIFEIFKRLHSQAKYTGSGVGLAICKKIVESHNGSIHLESQEGKGATFYIRLKAIVVDKEFHNLPSSTEIEFPRRPSSSSLNKMA